MQTQIKYIAAGVIIRDGCIFLAQRGHGCAAGLWEFPGGKVEDGETLPACLQRELHEELNITAEVGEQLCVSTFTSNNITYAIHFFYVPTFSGTLTLHEHTNSAWVTIDQLSTYAMPEADKPVVAYLQEHGI